ncbi:MAG TPA: SGNH/GDSL hydrolase family protein [Ruania sp.]|nr:SGNH/GDSL hydrolase family protein [Ruania sp.]
MIQPIEPANASPYWRGAYHWQFDGGLWRPWRLPPQRARRAHAPELIDRAQMAAGVRAECTTDAETVSLQMRVRELPEKPSVLDLTVDGELVQRVRLQDGDHHIEVALPPGNHDLCLWLPQAGYCAVGPLQLHGAEHCAPLPRRPRWVTYGSSISQCTSAAGPSLTWPALVAGRLGWDLSCLGFGGQCQLDPIVERTFESVEADVISLCLGINCYGGSTFSGRTFAAQVCGFIERVREAHPTVPILVMSPIASPEREETPNAAGLTLAQMRQMVSDAVHVLTEHDAHLSLIDGLEILPAADAYLLEDGLHPSTAGYAVMAERLAVQFDQLLRNRTDEP